MACWGCGEPDIVEESALFPDKEYPSFQVQPSKFEPRKKAKFKWLTRGGNTTLQSPPSNDQRGVHINRDWEQQSPRLIIIILIPGPRILGRANKTEVEIDGVVSKVLIDSGVIISMMSKDYAMNESKKYNYWNIWCP